MSQTQAIIDIAHAKVFQICEELKGKEIPNWWKFDDVEGFGFVVTEAELNYQVSVICYPIDDQPGNFLVRLSASFLSAPVKRQGYELLQSCIGVVYENDYPVYAEDNQELMDGVLQLISDEAMNILCRVLQ